MRIKLIGLLLAVTPLLFCQGTTPEAAKPEKITKMVRVRGNAPRLADLAKAGRQVAVEGDSRLHAVIIHATPAEVAEIEKTIHELDTIDDPNSGRKNVELIAYLIGGSMDAAGSNPDSGAELLAPVYKQLHAIFPYRSYQLVNTMLLRSGQEFPASTSGMLKSFQNNPDFLQPGNYRLQYDSASTNEDGSGLIHLAKFRFDAKIPGLTGVKSKDGGYMNTQYSMVEIGIETNVDLREGQKVVIGTSNVEPAGTTLFLVVTARLLP
jgi:hypothetical protein